jgi:hypothetical protein
MSLESINNPVLFSTMTTVAYNIYMRYFGGLHERAGPSWRRALHLLSRSTVGNEVPR